MSSFTQHNRAGKRDETSLEQRTIGKVSARLVPFLIACYFVAYLDRVNVSFAALTMNERPGLSAAQYGFGAGVFFLAYFVFEVPSNLLLERFGARKWIARIMFTWGLISGATGVHRRPDRLLRGARPAGRGGSRFFSRHHLLPDAVVPRGLPRPRSSAFSWRPSRSPPSSARRLSGLLLRLDGVLGFKGWQWLFILGSGAVADPGRGRLLLSDRSARRRRLAATPDERAWLVTRLAAGRAPAQGGAALQRAAGADEPEGPGAQRRLLRRRRRRTTGRASSCRRSSRRSGCRTRRPASSRRCRTWSASSASSVGPSFGRKLERRVPHRVSALRRRRRHRCVYALLDNPVLKMVAFCVAGFGIFGALPVFWTLPTAFLSGAAAAGGIAIINSIGNLAGFVGPYVMGRLKDSTGTYNAGLLVAVDGGSRVDADRARPPSGPISRRGRERQDLRLGRGRRVTPTFAVSSRGRVHSGAAAPAPRRAAQ